MKILKELLFGVRAEGYPLPLPTFKTVVPKNRPAEDVWAKQMKFGSRYGYRGSFYNNN